MPELDIQAILQRLVDGEVADEFEGGELPDPLDVSTLELGGNWVLTTRLGRLDVMQWIGENPLWAQLAPSAVEDSIAGLPIKIVGYGDLLKLKELAGRPEDVADIQRLREAQDG